MVIRKATLKDVPHIVVAAIDLLKYHENFDPNFAPAKNVEEVYRKHFKKCIRSRNKLLLVAESDSEIAGFALGEVSSKPPVLKLKKVGFISDIYVKRNFRKRGIAKYLLAGLIQWFKGKNLEFVELSVHVKNDVGRTVWAKCGFQDCTIRQRAKLNRL